MNDEKKSVALLVHSCDRYEFLYKGFEIFFSKHWDFSIPCNYYFATEEKKVTIKGFQNLQSGPGQWSDRLLVLLEKISADYVLYFQEDMWLEKDVDRIFFTELFDHTIAKDWKQVKLHSSEVYSTKPTSFYAAGFNIALVDNQKSDYLMSHQVTLWNKAFLKEQLIKGEHPWRNERLGTKRLRKLNATIFHADYFAENGKSSINTNVHPEKRSGYFTVSINGTLNGHVLPFIAQLQEGDVDEKEYASRLMLHYEHQITHDGKPKPRKEDIFKKIKKWILRK